MAMIKQMNSGAPNDNWQLVTKLIQLSYEQWVDWMENLMSEKPFSPVLNISTSDPIINISHAYNLIEKFCTEVNERQTAISLMTKSVVCLLDKYCYLDNEFEKNGILISLLSHVHPIEHKFKIESLIRNEVYLKWENKIGFNLHTHLIAEYVHIGNFEPNFGDYLHNFIDNKLNTFQNKSTFFHVALRYFRNNDSSDKFFLLLEKILNTHILNDEDYEAIIGALEEFVDRYKFKPIYEWYKKVILNKNQVKYIQFKSKYLKFLNDTYEEYHSRVFYNILFCLICNDLELVVPPVIVIELCKLIDDPAKRLKDKEEIDRWILKILECDIIEQFNIESDSYNFKNYQVRVINDDNDKTNDLFEITNKSHCFSQFTNCELLKGKFYFKEKAIYDVFAEYFGKVRIAVKKKQHMTT